MKDASRYHSLAWYRERIRVLNERNCATAAQLQATLEELLELSVGEMRAMVVAQVLQGFARLQQATPKDTGRAQAGWQIGTTSAVLDKAPPVIRRPPEATGNASGKKRLKTGFGKGDNRLPEYIAMIREAVPEPGDLTQADIIYIVNNVEYILMLEAGWSKQAPRGFIGNFLSTLRRELEQLAAYYRRQK